MNTLQTVKAVQARHISKGELADELYKFTYDTAIPQGMCDYISEEAGFNASSELVMGYPDHCTVGLLLPLTFDMATVLLRLSEDKLSTLMNWDACGIETGNLLN